MESVHGLRSVAECAIKRDVMCAMITADHSAMVAINSPSVIFAKNVRIVILHTCAMVAIRGFMMNMF